MLTSLIVLLAAGACAAPPESPAPPKTAAATLEGLQDINGTQLFIRRVGSGEPVLVIHGGPVMEHGYLLPHLEPLADDFELIFFDQRLSGRSAPRVDPETVRIATFVEDIEALRMALGLERIHLMAHSWGGLLAMHYALAHEENLRSLMLLDSMSASSELWQQEEAVLADLVTAEEKAERTALQQTEAFARRAQQVAPSPT